VDLREIVCYSVLGLLWNYAENVVYFFQRREKKMSLQFIVGSSGAGKTRCLYENLIRMSMEEPDGQFIAIVPEQFTMQTQKQIVSLHPNHGTMNIDIVSFQRLAYRIFEELGVENLEVLDDMGKTMVLRKVASEQRANLGLYAGHLNKTGFINKLKSMLSELYQYGIQPQDLKVAQVNAGPLLKEKLKDFEVIFTAFQEAIAERFITSEEILDVLCRVLPDSQLIRNSVITLDGYTGFTPVQYRILKLLMVHARKVIVTVSMDPAEKPYQAAGISHLFYMGKEMVRRLDMLAYEEGVSREKDIFLEETPVRRFVNSPSIGFIEQNLYRYHNRADWEPQEVCVYQADSPGQEIREVTAQIHRLVQEEKVRYREIAVITGDLPGYRYEIINRFQLEEIPYFMDDKKSILENVMVEFIRAALEAVRKDFDYESMFRFLKTGLVTADREELDRMENYVMAMGIRGWKRWNCIWENVYRGGRNLNLERLNAFREEILVPVAALRESLRQEDKTIRSMNEGVLACLEACQVREQLEQYRQYFEEHGQYSLAKEYEQVYDRVVELFKRLDALLGEEKVSLKEYAEILDAGFGEIQVGVIPATVDRVVVGDITRTRLDQIKVLFFVGVNEGIVPSKKDGGSLLTDVERELLKRGQMELAPTAKEDSFLQRYYLYLMMTKPSDRLIVSYASFDKSGKSLRPSSLISELRRMFPLLKVQQLEESKRKIYSRIEGKEQLIAGLRDYEHTREDQRFLELYRSYAESPEYRKLVEQLVEAAFYSYEKRGISKAAAKALYGRILQGSVTRLEKYAACAYAHFLNYGMELMERQEYQIASVDMGNMFHNAIDLCFKELEQQGKQVVDLTDVERTDLVKACVSRVTEEYGNTILKSSARNQYLAGRIERMTERTMWALAYQLRQGDFVPTGFEVDFSSLDHLKAMRIPLSDTEELHLRGRIDRVDLYEDDSKVYVKIIDYKSGGTRFDLAAVYYGLQLQLVVYMDAVLELQQRNHPEKEIVPAGIFYYNIKDPLVEKEDEQTPESILGDILEQLKMNGLVNMDDDIMGHMDHVLEGEDATGKSAVIPAALKRGAIQSSYSSVAHTEGFAALRQYVRNYLKKSGREILAGSIDAEPYKDGRNSACTYCPYHGVCGFDTRIKGYRYRRFPALKPEEVWPKIVRGGETDEMDR